MRPLPSSSMPLSQSSTAPVGLPLDELLLIEPPVEDDVADVVVSPPPAPDPPAPVCELDPQPYTPVTPTATMAIPRNTAPTCFVIAPSRVRWIATIRAGPQGGSGIFSSGGE